MMLSAISFTSSEQMVTLNCHWRWSLNPLGEERNFSKDGRSETSRSCEKRSEEHTSELQSHLNLVCRLLLEKKKIPMARLRCLLMRPAEFNRHRSTVAVYRRAASE